MMFWGMERERHKQRNRKMMRFVAAEMLYGSNDDIHMKRCEAKKLKGKISIMKRILSLLLIISSICFMEAKGESMYRSNGLSGNIIEWNGHVIVVSMTKHLFSKEYRLYVVTPDECKCIMHKKVPLNQSLWYYPSKDTLIERRTGNASPLSYSTIFIEYSYCKGSDVDDIREENFIVLPIEKKEGIRTIDGFVIKRCTDNTLAKLDTENNSWRKIDLQLEDRWSMSDYLRDTCICLNKSEALYYSPETDDIYQFPATKGVNPYSFILYKNQLVYAQAGGIYVCEKNNDVPEKIVSSSADFDIRRTTDLCIADDILYISNFERNQLLRIRLDNYESLPVLDIIYNSNTNFIIHNGYLYLIKEAHETIEYISIIDLESSMEVKRYSIK